MKKMTDADKAKLKRLAAGKGARSDGGLTSDQSLELLGLRDMERRSRSYSPKPMTAAAKKKAAAAGKATGAKTSARKPKAGSGVASKVVGRAKSTAREVRDVPTSVANAVSMWEANVGKGTKSTPQYGRMLKDVAKQTGEAVRSVATGKKGTAPLKVTKNRKDKFYGEFTNRMHVSKQAKPGKKRK